MYVFVVSVQCFVVSLVLISLLVGTQKIVCRCFQMQGAECAWRNQRVRDVCGLIMTSGT